MSTFQPEGRRTVMPRIITRDAAGLVRFIKAVLDARGDYCADAPAEMEIGDSIVMVSDGGGVKDADETYGRAIASGASVIDNRPTCVRRPAGDAKRYVGQHVADRDAQRRGETTKVGDLSP